MEIFTRNITASHFMRTGGIPRPLHIVNLKRLFFRNKFQMPLLYSNVCLTNIASYNNYFSNQRDLGCFRGNKG